MPVSLLRTEKGEGIHHASPSPHRTSMRVLRGPSVRTNKVILSGEFSGARVAYLATERDLGVVLEVFSGTPDDGAP